MQEVDQKLYVLENILFFFYIYILFYAMLAGFNILQVTFNYK